MKKCNESMQSAIHRLVVCNFDVINCLVNGDDFLGSFDFDVSFEDLEDAYQHLGYEISEGVGLEFCGGHFLTKECVYVRDIDRVIPKLGWSVRVNAGTTDAAKDALMKTICQCLTHVMSGIPIYSQLISSILSELTAVAATPVDMIAEHYWLRHISQDSSVIFTTSVSPSMRAAFAAEYQISVSSQLQIERSLRSMPSHVCVLPFLLEALVR
jgi:hypothetical protein